jgi:hypothetical protein
VADEQDVSSGVERFAAAQRLMQGGAQVLKLPKGQHIIRVGVYVVEAGDDLLTHVTSLAAVDLEVDETGMPKHVAFGHTAKHEGPATVDDPEFDHWACWCGDEKCEEFWRQ